jgi:hypothetical protein
LYICFPFIYELNIDLPGLSAKIIFSSISFTSSQFFRFLTSRVLSHSKNFSGLTSLALTQNTLSFVTPNTNTIDDVTPVKLLVVPSAYLYELILKV